MSDTLWIEHPDLGPDRRSKVTRRQFDDVWAASGWVEVDGPFDPAKHSVKEVIEHLEEHPDHKEDVLKMEKKGKSRTSLVDQIDD